jgi:hypothetical protein
MEEKQIVVKCNHDKNTGFIIWLIGFLFTISYIPVPVNFETVSFWEKSVYLIGNFILWPMVLGSYLTP